MRRVACPRCGTRVDLQVAAGVCPACQLHIAALLEGKWVRWVIVSLAVLALGVVARNLLPLLLTPIALLVLLLGGAGLILSLWRRTTYRRYYDPDFGSEE